MFNTPAASSQSVAELAFAHMFSLARFLHQSNHQMRIGSDFNKLKKIYSEGFQLRGKTLGIIGFGRIGQEAARLGLAMGMKVMPADIAVSQVTINLTLFHNENVNFSVTMETFDLDDVLRHSDFLTMHVPFSGGTPLIGKAQFAKMKTGAILVNTSRGGVVDEEAMLEALDSGKLAGAGLDVFDFEPKPRKEIIDHPKISMTPHIGAATIEAQGLIGLELADKILAFFGDDK